MIKNNNNLDVTNVFKIVNTYNGFTYSIMDKSMRCEIFNPLLDDEGQKNIIDEQKMTDFIKTIDYKIKKLNTNIDNQQKEKLISEITDNIHMCQRIGEPEAFMLIYHYYLQKRLLDNKFNINVEKTLVKLLNPNSTFDVYVKIEYTINDMTAIDVINTEFRKVNIKFETDKYDKKFQEIFDRNKTEFTVLRQSAWNTLKQNQRINEPVIIKSYLDMFKDFHSKYFIARMNKYACREIEYNYEYSRISMDLEIGDKKFTLKMNLIQGCILSYIVEYGTLSATKLSEIMNMSLKDMNNCINSLLLSKI